MKENKQEKKRKKERKKKATNVSLNISPAVSLLDKDSPSISNSLMSWRNLKFLNHPCLTLNSGGPSRWSLNESAILHNILRNQR